MIDWEWALIADGTSNAMAINSLTAIGNVVRASGANDLAVNVWNLNGTTFGVVKSCAIFDNDCVGYTQNVFSSYPACPILVGGSRYGGGSYNVNGTPQGQVAEIVGATATRRDGGAGTTFYVKESGTGNTGWVAK